MDPPVSFAMLRVMSTKESTSRETKGGVLGLGLDTDDGHRRVTQGDDFLLLGGSHDTHARMQDMVVRMSETLRKQGRRFEDLSRREFEDLARSSLK